MLLFACLFGITTGITAGAGTVDKLLVDDSLVAKTTTGTVTGSTYLRSLAEKATSAPTVVFDHNAITSFLNILQVDEG